MSLFKSILVWLLATTEPGPQTSRGAEEPHCQCHHDLEQPPDDGDRQENAQPAPGMQIIVRIRWRNDPPPPHLLDVVHVALVGLHVEVQVGDVVALMPLTYLTDALRQIMVGASSLHPLWLDFAVLGG